MRMRIRTITAVSLATLAAFGCEHGQQPLAPSLYTELQLASLRCQLLASDELVLSRVQTLHADVDALEAAGALNAGQARALRNHLGNVQRHIKAQQYCPARAQLKAFREQVDNFVRDNVLTNRQAYPLYHGERVLYEPLPQAPGAERYAPGEFGEFRTALYAGEEITYEVIDGLAIFQGDVILGYADEIDELFAAGPGVPPEPFLSAAGDLRPLANICDVTELTCERWTNATIGFDFANDWGDDETNRMMRARIAAAMSHWEERAGLRFERRLGGERLVFRDAGGCSSWVGRNPVTGLDPQWMNLSTRCGEGNIIHEIGHAVGMYHEHARRDRDHHVVVDMGAIPVDWLPQYYRYSAVGHDIARYDHYSIMHYPCMFADTDVQVIFPRTEGITCAGMGQRDALTESDILSFYTLYRPQLQIAGALPGDAGWEFELHVASTPRVHEDFLYWSSNLVEGDIGTGRTLSVGRGDLPDGRHVIEVRAELWGEVVARRSITLDIFDPTPSIQIVSPTSGQQFLRAVQQVFLSADVQVYGHALHEVTWTTHRLSEPFMTGNNVGYALLPYGQNILRATVTDLERGLSARSEPVGIYIVSDELQLQLVKPSLVTEFCTREFVEFVASAQYPGSPDIIPADRFTWEPDGASDRVIAGDRASFRWDSEGPSEVRVTVRDHAGTHTASVHIDVQPCDQIPPEVRVLTPPLDTPPFEEGFQIQGFDEEHGLWYVDIQLEGQAKHWDGGPPIPPEAMFWTTNRTDMQGALLGTGRSLTARLYMGVSCGTDWHDIRFGATDSSGRTRVTLRRIQVWNFC